MRPANAQPRWWDGLAGRLAAGFAVVAVATIAIVVLALGRLTGSAFAAYVSHVEAMRSMMGAAMPVPDPADFMDSLRRSLLLAGVGGALLSALAGLVVARHVTRPLRAIEEAADRIARGDVTTRIPATGSAELRRLAEAFNSMSEALAQSSESRKQFLASVAHELRTPLAVLQAEIEALQDGVLDFDAERVEGLAEEVRLIGRIVGDLQVLAVADAGALRLERAAEPVEPLLKRAAAAMRDLSAQGGVHIEVRGGSGLPPVFVDAVRVEQVLTNLLANAARYTPTGGTVRIFATSEGDAVRIAVEDSGPGIAPEDLPRVFDRFFRASSASSRNGTGLGLSIVRELVTAHGGDVRASNAASGGARFEFTLPVADAGAAERSQPPAAVGGGR